MLHCWDIILATALGCGLNTMQQDAAMGSYTDMAMQPARVSCQKTMSPWLTQPWNLLPALVFSYLYACNVMSTVGQPIGTVCAKYVY